MESEGKGAPEWRCEQKFGGRGASRVTLRGQRWEEERGRGGGGVHREAGDESRGPENLGIRNPENQTLRAGPGS